MMYARSDMPISFPGLFGEWEFNPSPVALDIGNGIYWYGIIICFGLLLAVWFCGKQANRYGLTEDNVYDLIIWEIPFCIIGARLYYVIFYLDLYRNSDGSFDFGRMIAIWDGGLAIYGAVIVAFTVLWFFCKAKKISFGAFADLGVMGLLIGQAIGRWGNFMNREAFGAPTEIFCRMGLTNPAGETIYVHPTFLYEMLWNLGCFIFLSVMTAKGKRRYDGQFVFIYFLWYGIGRTWIEGLRTDSLYIGGTSIRVSQALSIALALISLIVLIYKGRQPHSHERLYVYSQTKKNAEAQAPAGEEINKTEEIQNG